MTLDSISFEDWSIFGLINFLINQLFGNLTKNKKYLSYGVAFSFQHCKFIPNNNLDVPLKGMITEKGLQTI